MGQATLGDRADAIATLEAASRAFPAWYKTTGDGAQQIVKKQQAKSFMTKVNTCKKSWTIP